MPLIIYPKDLLESWASVGAPGKPVRRPVMEARTGDGDEGTGDIDSELGQYSSIVDYEGDDEMGYSEPGVNKDLDRQDSRLGMSVHEIDPETGNPADGGEGEKGKKRQARGSDYRAALERLRQRRLFDIKSLFREISGLAGEYVGHYREMPEDYFSDGMRDALSTIEGKLNTPMDGSDPVSYVQDTQTLIRSMEMLGISARENNSVPDGIPENLINVAQLSTLIYLSDDEKHLMRFMTVTDANSGDVPTLVTGRLAARATAINKNIAGTGDSTEPVMPPPGENLYISSFAPWSGLHYRPTNGAEALRANPKGRLSGYTNEVIPSRTTVEYLGTHYNASATAMVPHPLFEKVKDRIVNDRSLVHKKSREGMMGHFHDSYEETAANLMIYGYDGLKDWFGVSPPRMKETSSPCFIGLSSNREGSFTSTVVCLKALKEMLTTYKSEIEAGRASLVDSSGTQFDEFPARYIEANGSSYAGGMDKITAIDLLERIIATINKNLGGSTLGSRAFVSPELYTLIEKSFSLKRKPRRVRENGEWVVKGGDPIPLFDFFSTNISKSYAKDIYSTDGHEGMQQRTLAEKISYDDNSLDYANTNEPAQTLDGYINTFLVNSRCRQFVLSLGIPAESIPSPDAPEKERVKFFTDLILKYSDIMRELGSTSYIVRRPGNTLEVVIGDEDKEAYGRDVSIADAWRKAWRAARADEARNDAYGEEGGGDTTEYSPDAARFLAASNSSRSGMITYMSRILKWLRSYQNYEYDGNDLVSSLTGLADEFAKAKSLLDPYLEPMPLVISIASSDLLRESGRHSDAFKFAARYINQLQKETNVNILSPSTIEMVVNYVKSSYDDEARMLEFASREPPLEWEQTLEWCVVRFLMSGIGDNRATLVPPDEVGTESGAGGNAASAQVPPILRKYREILAAKPAYMKRDAWLRHNNIKPEIYDYMEREASGENPDARIIDMSVGEISGWLTDEYIKFGDLGEIILLLLGLLRICGKVRDADLHDITTFKENGATQRLHYSSMHRMLRLTDALQEYGPEFLGRIIADLSGDGGESLSALLRILSAHEPFTEDELAAVLGCNEGGVDQGVLADSLEKVIARLAATSFLTFNGIV